MLKLKSSSIRHMVRIFDVRTPFSFFFSITFMGFSQSFGAYPVVWGVCEIATSKSERKGKCEHSMRCPKFRPGMLDEVSSFIFDHPSWNIFVGTVACRGSIILGVLLGVLDR